MSIKRPDLLNNGKVPNGTPVPGIDIRGVKGINAETINGIYEPTEESSNGWPVYRKRGDPNKWLESNFSLTNKWYVKATTDKGRARGWMRISCDPPSRPEQCKSMCEVWDGSKWVPQSSVSILTIKQRKEEDRVAGATRLANAVAVDIRGATGPSAASINGVYTPTDEIVCGWPIYRKEGDPDKWLEFMVNTNEWYVKPTADRGRSEGWMCLASDPPAPPELSRGVCEVWDGEKWQVQNSLTVLTAECAFENMLEVQIFCAEETRDLQEKLNDVCVSTMCLLNSPVIWSSSGSVENYGALFTKNLLNILSGGSSSSNSTQAASSSSTALPEAEIAKIFPAGDRFPVIFSMEDASKLEAGKQQFNDLLAELDDRLEFLMTKAGEDDDDDDSDTDNDIPSKYSGDMIKVGDKPHDSDSPLYCSSSSAGLFNSLSENMCSGCQCKECGGMLTRRLEGEAGAAAAQPQLTQQPTQQQALTVAPKKQKNVETKVKV